MKRKIRSMARRRKLIAGAQRPKASEHVALSSHSLTTGLPIIFSTTPTRGERRRAIEESVMSATSAATSVSIVLVHGGFVDGSGWEGVYNILKKDGYNVSIVQNPTISLADDVAVDQARLAAQPGPVILVGPLVRRRGHHRGRQRSQGRGARLHRRVRARQGRVGASLIKDPPPGAPVPPILPPQDGFLFLDKAKFACVVRGRRGRRTRPRSWRTRRCRGAWRRSSGAVSEPAWKTKPSWYLVATDDRMIPPPAQRLMSKRAGATVVEVKGSQRSTSRSRMPLPRSSKGLRSSRVQPARTRGPPRGEP